MTDYPVLAKKWEHGWELHIKDIGVTQSHGLNDAESMAREYIALCLDIPEDAIGIDLSVAVGPESEEAVQEARAAERAAEQARRCAAAKSREAVRRLRAAGLNGREIAHFLGVSPQRVSQLSRD